MTTSSTGTADAVIRVTFLTRLIVLALSSFGLATRLGTATRNGDGVTEGALALLFCVLAVTSFLGLSGRGLTFLQRHPAVALLDVLLVVATLLGVGGTSGVVLLGISSALLVGVLLPARVSAPMAVLLVTGYLAAVLRSPGGATADFLVLVGMPLIFVSLTAVGAAVRSSSRAEQQAAAELLEVRALAAASEERLRLARDLHDVVGKSVQGVALHAQVLPRLVGRDRADLDAQAHRVVDAATDAVRSVRQVMAGMRSAAPGTALAEAVRTAVEDWQGETGRDAGLTVQDEDPSGRCDGSLQQELVAVLREALENVRRHAPGCEVHVRLERDPRRVVLEVRDHGPGLDTDLAASAPTRGHFGLVGMRERVEGLGGRLTTAPTPGGGTTVRATVPTTAPAPAPHAVTPEVRSAPSTAHRPLSTRTDLSPGAAR